jgi:hypothetical protein
MNYGTIISLLSGTYVTAWKRGIAILTAGQVKVTPDPRVRLVNGYTLQIRDAVPSDAGDYICQIATLEPREITHHVEILSKYDSAFPNKIYEKLFRLGSFIILLLQICIIFFFIFNFG